MVQVSVYDRPVAWYLHLGAECWFRNTTFTAAATYHSGTVVFQGLPPPEFDMMRVKRLETFAFSHVCLVDLNMNLSVKS